MTIPLTPDGTGAQGASTRPYLIRALHDWCTDNGFTPYLAVFVDGGVQVPAEYVKNSEIVLNISIEATSSLQLGNEFISFKARFGGVAREIAVPVDHVIAIYARENGQGMAFPAPAGAQAPSQVGPDEATPGAAGEPRGLRLAPASSEPTGKPARTDDDPPPEPPPPEPGAPKPALKRVK